MRTRGRFGQAQDATAGQRAVSQQTPYRTRIGEHTIFSRRCTTVAPPDSPCLVLIHGFVASSRYMVPAMRELAPYCRVHAPDLPGWGESAKPRHALGLAELADVLAQWIQEMGIRRPILLGNSFGCQVVAELAVRYPDIPSGLILLGPTVDPRARSILRQGARLALDVPREKPSLWLLELWDLVRMGLPRAVETIGVMMDDRIEEKLPSIAAVTLIVRGSRDPIAPRKWTEAASRLLPQGRLLFVPGAPHAANYSTPGQLTAAILPFIQGELNRPPGEDRL